MRQRYKKPTSAVGRSAGKILGLSLGLGLPLLLISSVSISRAVQVHQQSIVRQLSPTLFSQVSPWGSGDHSSAGDRSPLQVESLIQSDWQTGFCVSFKVMNQGNTPSGNWRLVFSMRQAEISQSWNGGFVREGGQYIVNPPDWAKNIQPGQTVDLGFCANKRGSDYQPTHVMVTVL